MCSCRSNRRVLSNMLISLLFTLELLGSVTCTFYTHSKALNQHNDSLNIGLILPHTNFGVREYIKAINNAVASLHRSRVMTRGLSFLKKYNFSNKNVHHVLMKLTPSPTGKTVEQFEFDRLTTTFFS